MLLSERGTLVEEWRKGAMTLQVLRHLSPLRGRENGLSNMFNQSAVGLIVYEGG